MRSEALMSTRHEGLLEAGRSDWRCRLRAPSTVSLTFLTTCRLPSILPEKGAESFSTAPREKDPVPFSIPLAPIEATCYSVNRPLISFCLNALRLFTAGARQPRWDPAAVNTVPAASITLSNSPIVRDVLGNELRILTERMTQVRSVSIGVWLTARSRHESADKSGIAHFVEHMLFKGTATRSAEDIAQAIDSIGGQLDAFHRERVRQLLHQSLDEHLPLAMDILTDIVRIRRSASKTSSAKRRSSSKRFKMVEDTPTTSSTSSSRRASGKTIRSGVQFLGTARRSSRSARQCCASTSSRRIRPAI